MTNKPSVGVFMIEPPTWMDVIPLTQSLHRTLVISPHPAAVAGALRTAEVMERLA
jgi:hypothetical protein